MDKKTKDRILKYYLDHQELPVDYCEQVLNSFPDLSEEIICAAIEELEDEGLVAIALGNGSIPYVQVKQRAYGYFREAEEAERNQIAETKIKQSDKWAERRWSLLMYVLGIVSTLFTQWVKSKFFP